MPDVPSGSLRFRLCLLTESACARTVCGARQLQAAMPQFANMTFPKAIHFTHKEPGYRAEYDRIFGVPLIFESHMNAIIVDEGFLSIRLPDTNPYLSKILKTHADELLKNLENSKSTRGRVESLLLPILHTGEVSIATITAKLGVSRQTLFRKLKAEGVSYEQVLDELRHTLALRYLKEKKMSVTETAYRGLLQSNRILTCVQALDRIATARDTQQRLADFSLLAMMTQTRPRTLARVASAPSFHLRRNLLLLVGARSRPIKLRRIAGSKSSHSTIQSLFT